MCRDSPRKGPCSPRLPVSQSMTRSASTPTVVIDSVVSTPSPGATDSNRLSAGSTGSGGLRIRVPSSSVASQASPFATPGASPFHTPKVSPRAASAPSSHTFEAYVPPEGMTACACSMWACDVVYRLALGAGLGYRMTWGLALLSNPPEKNVHPRFRQDAQGQGGIKFGV